MVQLEIKQSIRVDTVVIWEGYFSASCLFSLYKQCEMMSSWSHFVVLLGKKKIL